MKNVRRCKEEACPPSAFRRGCLKKVAGGKSIKSYAARKLGYCLKHYKDRFPDAPKRARKRPVCRQGSQMVLSWSQRIEMEKSGFNQSVWSPEFRKEMREYWKAKGRGELL